jgi:hypothetical protein
MFHPSFLTGVIFLKGSPDETPSKNQESKRPTNNGINKMTLKTGQGFP